MKISIIAILLLSSATMSFMTRIPRGTSKPRGFPPFRISENPQGNANADIEECKIGLFEKLIPNYNVEEHKVTTEDGYILTVFRVNSKDNKDPNSKPAVFLQHGITEDGHAFFLGGEELGLGNLLAQAGFDVWVGNSRGSKYSREHKTLDIKSKEYWEFSFMQMGQFDVPANLAYIKKVKIY